MPFAAFAIVEAIDDLREEIKDKGDAESAIERAEAVIERGEATTKELPAQVRELEAEKAELQRIQTALTSGLIGANVTAIVAISGAIMKTMSAKHDRDMRRLEVSEKIASLETRGIAVPADIHENYSLARPPGGRG